MLLDQLADSVDLFPAEAVAALQPDGVEPELRLAVVALNMDVRWLDPIAGVEEEPEWPHPKYSRHVLMLRQPAVGSNTSHRANREQNGKARQPALMLSAWQR